MIKRLKTINYRFYLCIIISFLVALLSYKFYRSYIRIIESFRDFGLSVYFYFTELFSLPNYCSPTINKLSSVSTPFSFNFISFENFGTYFNLGFNSLINFETLRFYFSKIASFINILARVLLLIIPFFLLLWLMYKNYFKESGLEINEDSKPLRIYKLLKLKIIVPIINWVKSFIAYIRCHRYFLTIWIVLLMFYFNFFTIIIEFLAFYFYFVMSFDFGGIFIQVYKLLLDLMPMILFVPFPIWIVLALRLFNNFRKNIALSILNHHEFRNRGFINDNGISKMIVGEMGKSKTLLMTDIGLSQAVMFRDKAFELILKNDLKFPNFTFSVFESEIKKAIKYHQIYNLASCRLWLYKKAHRFSKNPCIEKLFDYDYEKYGMEYWNGAQNIHLFEMLENYVQLYFIYVMESSLLITNYSIREDSILQDLGHFPMWHNDFFNTSKEYMQAYSRHSHILDFDMLRLGKTFVEDNKYRDAFEFGVILITEGGKERGNALENKGMKKIDVNANRLNDLFNNWLKMVRHSATVDYFPFVTVLFDEQRAMSMGADVRDICNKIINIDEKEEVKTPLLLFRLETMIHDFLSNKCSGLYYKYRFVRSDNTLFMYLLKNIWGHYEHYYDRLKNHFSYHKLDLSCEKGTLDKTLGKNKYYISHKKIYSRRYATDAFKDYFMQKALNSVVGLNDLPTYESEVATLNELEQQHSYFISELMNMRNFS